MSTASLAILGGGTVAASNRRRDPEPEENPRARRFLVNPGVPNFEVHPTLSGRQQATIPHGVPFKVENFDGMKVRNWSVDPDDTSPPDAEADFTAKYFADNILRAAWQSSRDMGTRELRALTTLSDEEAGPLIAAVFPQLDPRACPYGEENTSEVTVEWIEAVKAEGAAKAEDVAQARKVSLFRCLSCTLAWLKSPECESEAARHGEHGLALRGQALDAYETNQKFFRTLWGEWNAEMKKRSNKEPGIAVLDDGHLHVMRQIHEVEPEMRAAEVLRESQERSAEAQREGMREFAREFAATMKDAQPQAPAVDRDALKRELMEELRAELRAQPDTEQPQPKPGKAGR